VEGVRKIVVYELLSLDGVAEDPDSFFADRGDHEVWSLDGVLVVVPRHREVNDMTALHIHLDLEGIPGPRWLRR
jgi:hypothetical protein